MWVIATACGTPKPQDFLVHDAPFAVIWPDSVASQHPTPSLRGVLVAIIRGGA